MAKAVTTKKEKPSKEQLLTRFYILTSVLLIVGSLLFSVFRFERVFPRIIQSFVDVGLSIAFYFTELCEFHVIKPTVGVVPVDVKTTMPAEWAQFRTKLVTFGKLLISKDNLKACFSDLWGTTLKVLEIVMMIAPIVALIIFGIVSMYNTENIEYDRKTKPRRAFEAVERAVYLPVKAYVVGYIRHLKTHRLAWGIFVAVWLYNLNVFTIMLEAFAYLMYFAIATFSIHALYAQLVKLVYDLGVPVDFLPWWVWAIIIYKVIDKIRRSIGMQMLYHYENVNRAFLKLYLGALFICGKQRTKKTTLITDMAMTQEVIFREEAQERLAIRDKQFPHFPWQNVEVFYRNTLKKHSLPTLASMRDFVAMLREMFEKRALYAKLNPKAKEARFEVLRRKYGYTWNDFIFGYDYERYGMTYYDNLTVINIFDAIEAYLQLFYIYAAPTSLIFGNYSVRTDLQWYDNGNYPELDADFFTRDPRNEEEKSQNSHVAHLDNFRLYKVVNPSDPYIDGFEAGILDVMEWAKERGNQITNQGVKADDNKANAKNDGFELNMKIQTHQSTIDNYTFFRLLMDDHRPDSLGADNKDLCNIIMVKEVSEARVVMPFYTIGSLVYGLATKLHDKIYYHLRRIRGDANGTLLVYLMKKIYTLIFRHHDRIVKQFSVYTAKLNIEDAMQKETLTDKGKYYISMKKTYSDRFATDGLKQFYHRKALGSKYGLNDFPTFKDKHISVQEMEESGSLFYKRVIDAFYAKELQRSIAMQRKRKK